MMEVVTSWEALMRYARELGPARLRGNPARIREAKEHHEASAALCRKADRMLLPFSQDNTGSRSP